MQIQSIENAIMELETAETTVKNVSELADLYIIRDHYKNTNSASTQSADRELKDILPQYVEYIRIKRRFQRGDMSEEAVIKSIQSVCKEIVDFINALYSGTDLPEERTQIKIMAKDISTLFS